MSSINQKEYLKRYLSGVDTNEKKTKKRRKKRTDNVPAVKVPRSVIVDDDVDVRAVARDKLDDDKSSLLDEPDEAPLVAAFVDERPEDEVKLEQYRSSDKWKTMGDDDVTSRLQTKKDLSPVQRKPRHDSPMGRRKRHDSDSDLSPQRAVQRKGHDSDSDVSPVRKSREQTRAPQKRPRERHDSDSDLSPPRTNMSGPNARHDSDSDMSPPRKRTDRTDEGGERGRRRRRHDSDSDLSPPRGKNHNCNEDEGDEIPRTKARRHDSDSEDLSLPRKRNEQGVKDTGRRRHDSDSDLSPPRGKIQSRYRDGQNDRVPRTKARRHDSDSEDLSPPRLSKGTTHRDKRSRHDSDSNQSPARRPGPGSIPVSQKDRHRPRHDSDSDLSPPRGQRSKGREGQGRSRAGSDPDLSPQRNRDQGRRGKGERMDSDSDLSPDRGKGSRKDEGTSKPTKTLSGAKAGLSDAATLRRENEETRKRTNKAYLSLTDDASGRNAETVFRDKGGKRRDLKSEKRLQREQEERRTEEDEQFMQWGKGLAQMKQQQDRVEDAMREMAKPLARYKDDQDLDQMLKEQDREGDPMLAFLKKKESKAMARAGIKEKPKYRGPKPAPNRFNIQPGHRWDGVDRSNGFERKYFQRMSDKKATSQMAYMWSIEDM